MHALLITNELCEDQAHAWGCDLSEAGTLGLAHLVRAQRAKRQMHVTVGEVAFMRLQGWLVILVYLFRPNSSHEVGAVQASRYGHLSAANRGFVSLGMRRRSVTGGQFF